MDLPVSRRKNIGQGAWRPPALVRGQRSPPRSWPGWEPVTDAGRGSGGYIAHGVPGRFAYQPSTVRRGQWPYSPFARDWL